MSGIKATLLVELPRMVIENPAKGKKNLEENFPRPTSALSALLRKPLITHAFRLPPIPAKKLKNGRNPLTDSLSHNQPAYKKNLHIRNPTVSIT
jgi:hypothetical protein